MRTNAITWARLLAGVTGLVNQELLLQNELLLPQKTFVRGEIAVQPDILTRWHRKGFRLFSRWRSKPTGRPRLPKLLRQLIREMATQHLTWGQERIANELKLKLGFRVSPRTVEKYLRHGPVRTPNPKQRWLTFVHNRC